MRLPVAKTPLLTEGSKSSTVTHLRLLAKCATRLAAERLRPCDGAPPRLTVLIVDDNLQAAEGIAETVEPCGARRTHRTTAQARSTPRVIPPEIIFLDIGLPDGSGYELAQKMRQYLSPQPIIVALTGYGQEEDKQRARRRL